MSKKKSFSSKVILKLSSLKWFGVGVRHHSKYQIITVVCFADEFVERPSRNIPITHSSVKVEDDLNSEEGYHW